MEEAVAAAIMVARAVDGQDLTIVVNVACVKELVIVVARFAAARDVGADVIEVPKSAGEGYVASVI